MEQDLDLLLAKYFSEEVSETEKTQAEDWIKEHPEEAQILQEAWEASKTPRFTPNVDLAWNKVQTSIQPTETKHIPLIQQPFFRWVAAAIVIIAVGVIGWKFTGTSGEEWLTKAVKTRQSTPLVLADGSQVWLNKNSKIRYPKDLQGNERVVYLEGEAFFDVRANAQKPFIIYSGNTATKVLGTSFNVQARPQNGTVEVTVASGQVALYETKRPKTALMLNKNERGVYNKEQQQLSKKTQIDPNTFAWKTGVFAFQKSTLKDVLVTLNEYYEIPIRVANDQLNSCVLTTTLERLSLKDAIEVIQLTLNISSRMSPKEVILEGTCNQ